ncbi:MAG: hypothetical protein ACKVP5_01305 [Aestuariivirga sp.]
MATSTCALADEFSQQVVRINPVAGDASPSATLKDCIADDYCQAQVLFALTRIGGDPALLNEPPTEWYLTTQGETTHFGFVPPKDQFFCRAELVKLSVAPTLGESATELRFYVSANAASITVRFPKNPPRAWFDGLLVLLASPRGEGCTLTNQVESYTCKGRCKTVRF